MATLTLTPSLFEQLSPPDFLDQPADGITLEDVIAATWQEIRLGVGTTCPICHGELKPVWSAGPRPVGGRCQDCGARLS